MRPLLAIALGCLLLAAAGCDGYSSACTPAGPWTGDRRPDGELNGTCAPVGETYESQYSCDEVVGPCRGDATQGATAQVAEDPARLDDPDLPWVQGQLQSCSCSCCHNNAGESAHIWSWDFGPVWTDSIDTERLGQLANTTGRVDNIAPEDNEGFSRSVSDFPSTDGQRLVAYLLREEERRR